MPKLYSQIDSGNCYKPRLLMAKLNLPFEHIALSSIDGSTRKPEFLAKNPNGKVPLLEFDDGRLLAESNAILLHLAEGSRFIPEDTYERALMYQWLFFEQYTHEPNIAVRRALLVYPERAKDATPERLAATLEGGNKALLVMESQLQKTSYFTGSAMSIADIALYAYTHEANRGGYDLSAYPAVAKWLSRIAADEGHVPISWLPE
jgi:glutathione S-transferase